MMLLNRVRIRTWVLGLLGTFLLLLGFFASGLVWNLRQDALADSEAQATRFVSGAETAINRTFLGVDVLLASMDDLLQLSKIVSEWIDPVSSNRLMRGAVNQNMLVRHVALVDTQGRVITSSDPSGAHLSLSLPTGFVDESLAQPVSTLIVSAPVVSFASSEQVVYLARWINLADSAKVLAIAEVPITLLTSIMVQGVDISGLEVTLERNDGQLLASVPAREQREVQTRLPALAQQNGAIQTTRMPARLSGKDAILVARPILYRDLLLTAGIPLDAALADWRVQRNFILGISLVFALMILAAGGFALQYLARLRQARSTITQAKASLDQALESMVSGFLLLDAQGRVASWNRRFHETYPWLEGVITPQIPFQELLTVAAKNLIPEGSETEWQEWIQRRLDLQCHAQGTHEQHLPGGKIIHITERRTPQGGTVIVYQDMTELRTAAAEIEQLAFFDPLTGLPNRRLLMDRVQHAQATSERSGHYGSLLFLDLDHFKTLNDTLGHDVGDQLLQQVAGRLKACVREEDTVSRLGGDEFVLMLEDLSPHPQEAAMLARRIGEKIVERLNQPYQLASQEYHSTPSIGAALFLGDSISATDLLRQADIAMYQVKAAGRNALCFFDPQMQAAITARARLEDDLRTALTLNQFELYYQPQLQLAGQVVGAEVLIRWKHPVRGMVSPAEFIPVAEESELISLIGEWVLRTACEQLALWQEDERYSDLQLSVNVSARQLRQAGFVDQVATIMRETGVKPHLLKLELTESLVLVSVDDTITKMQQLKALGVQFSIDDFGTGHSSLAYLTRLPLDQLKIDQSFVRNIGIRHTDGVIVQTIIGMARNLGLEVIAEGVETLAQQEFLALHGCNMYQGYLFGKPSPLVGFEGLLATVLPCTSN
jgi:diguanylate cyclase (GGDEF)-like protein